SDDGFERALALVRHAHERATECRSRIAPCIIAAGHPRKDRSAEAERAYVEKRAAIVQAGCVLYEKSGCQGSRFLSGLQARISEIYSQFEGGEKGEFVMKRDQKQKYEPIGETQLGTQWEPVGPERSSESEEVPSEEDGNTGRSTYARPPFAISRDEYGHLW